MKFAFEILKKRIEYNDGWVTIYAHIPKSDTEYWLSAHRKALEENPKNTSARFMLANVLRMDGQIRSACIEYEKVVQDNHNHYSQTATKILKEYEGIHDHQSPIKWEQRWGFCLKPWVKRANK